MIVSPTNLLWQQRYRGLLGVTQHQTSDEGLALLIKPDDFETRTYQLLSVDANGHAVETGAVGVETIHKFPGVVGGGLLIGMTDDDIYVFRDGRKVRFLPDRRVTYTDVSLAPQRGWFICAFSDSLFSTHGLAFGDSNARLGWTKDLQAAPNRVAITHDGKVLVAGLQSGRVIALDNMRAPIWESILEEPVTALALGATALRPVVGTAAGTLLALDEEGGVRWRTPVGVPVLDVAVDAESRWAAAVCSDGGTHLLVCLGTEGGTIWEYELDSRPTGVSLSPNGRYLLVTTASGLAAMFDIDFSEAIETPHGRPTAVDEARLAAAGGDWAYARELLAGAVDAAPHDAGLAAELLEAEARLVAEYRTDAARQRENGCHRQALEALTAAARIAPWDPELFQDRLEARNRLLSALAERAETQGAVHDWEGARQTWREVLELDPSRGEAREALRRTRDAQAEEWRQAGDACHERGDLLAALGFWQQAQRLNPTEEGEARLRRAETERCLTAGIAHYEAGRMAEAIFQLKKVLALEPGHEQAVRYLGYAQGITGDHLIADRFARLE